MGIITLTAMVVALVSSCAPAPWNNFPLGMTIPPSAESFNSKLKTFLFNCKDYNRTVEPPLKAISLRWQRPLLRVSTAKLTSRQGPCFFSATDEKV